MLSDERVYKKLKKDPTRGYKEKLVALHTGLKDENKISWSQYRDLYTTSDLVPWLYGSSKIHKSRNLLCPIMDYTGLLAYATSKAIANLLKPLVGRPSYHVKNTATFSNELKSLQVEENNIMNAHDVVSLFTNVPITKALEVTRKKIEEDKTLSDSTKLDANDVMSLLEFVMSTTYFQFDGQYYQQIHSVPMGSPISVIMSDIFMENLEEEAMDTALLDTRPKIWQRYIDISFEVVHRDK